MNQRAETENQLQQSLNQITFYHWLGMTTFVDLQRRFRDLTHAELEDPEVLASLNEHDVGAGIGWPELLQEDRVVILAEAGGGKTREMNEQRKRLVSEGRFAFFVALESLDREPLGDLLSAAEEESFEAWKADTQAPAWFFLDAVDELKLTEGKLDRALFRLAKSIGQHLDRARIVISCRPNDWRPSFDLATVLERLPMPTKIGTAPPMPADEVFLAALRNDRDVSPPKKAKEKERESLGTARIVLLLPMSNRQIRLYAERSDVHDADAFLAEIDRQNAWTFARRPLDLAELIATWTSSGRLGTRAEQHEANVQTKLMDIPERPDRGVLSETQARLGAERLALGLALTRTRTLRSPDQTLDVHRTEGVLDPATILPDWSEKERQALLRRALFDPATYGRVRFHHRSVQEYLAARRLKALREKGMSTKALFRLLFAKHYGVDVVYPSMRAIAAWLALWDDVVRRELTKREPELLLLLGDPESLSMSARGQLVKAFVDAYGEGSWRGLSIPIDELRRLAHPELAPVIRELWGEGPTNPDVRELLIELIWQGPIEACADFAEAAALNASWDSYHRVAAVKALVACGKTDVLRSIADNILTHPASWPDKIVHGVAASLFPRIISVDELITLIERIPEPKRSTRGFHWVAREIVEAIQPLSEHAVALRDKLADLIWRGRNSTQEFYRIRGKFDYLTYALARLCEQQLAMRPAKVDPELISACVIASRFDACSEGRHEELSMLQVHFQDGTEFRSKAFWAELAFMDEVAPAKDDWDRFYQAGRDSLLGHLTEADLTWLEVTIADRSRPECRAVALHALLRIWQQSGRLASELDALRAKVKGDIALEAIIDEQTRPAPRNEEREKMEQKLKERQRRQASKEAQRIQNWTKWRDELLADPASAFTSAHRACTIKNLYSWLNAQARERNCFNMWDKLALSRAFGQEIADMAEREFRAQWRTTTPQLWTARPPNERNSTPYLWIYGLCGVFAEAATPGWANSLSPTEAAIAAAYATLELNGFASFIHELATAHPSTVEAVIGGELSAELRLGGDNPHLPILQSLTYTERGLKQLMSPRLLTTLPTWPRTFTEGTARPWSLHLDQVLRILDETVGESDRQQVVEECIKRYVAEPTGPLALTWLRGLFRFDAQRGTEVIAAGLNDPDNHSEQARAIETFAGLFGERDSVLFNIADPAQRAEALGQLVRIAYAYVRREDDQVHEGTYSPNTRDHAESARNFLLSALLDTPGPVARRVILELAAEPNFAHFPDRLRLLARERAAADAEFPPYDVNSVAALETRYEAPPHDRDGLFAVMLDRLEDLAHDVAHYDFTDRRTLRSIEDEVEMQRTLAWRVDGKANGAYVVTREDEVADQKRTDIRISAVKGDQKAVAEVKLADQRWSLAQLEHALRHQLVGQYLRHAQCKAGCLLLTYDGTKKYWMHPGTRKRMRFLDMVDYLNQKAREIEMEHLQEFRLAVFGLDLTDPPLASAHR